MALLDRFRTQTPQHHPDPAVRLAFVQDIPIDERVLLAEIARDDADTRVRRAAVAKLMDPPALAAVVKDEADEGVRAQAVAMLRDIAVEAFEGIGEAESHAAVDAVGDAKTLALIARSAPRESTADRALARVIDGHALGSIARHAEHESVRRAAYERLQDPAEILAVALNSEFKDPTVAAVERVSDRAELEQIAARAKNKSAVKRARTIVREMDERAAREAAGPAEAAAAPAVAVAAAKAAEPDPADVERAAQQQAAEREAAEARTRAEEGERVRAQEEAARRREQVAAAERARAEAAEHAARLAAERRYGRQTELAVEIEAASTDADIAVARRRLGIARREWQALGAGNAVDPDLAARVAAADAAFIARDAAAHENDQRARRDALGRIQQLLARVEPLADRADLTLKVGERGLKDVRSALGAIPQLPSKLDYDAVVRRLKAVQTALMPKVQELRDLADWQRWANVGIQEQLCEKMAALKGLEDPEEIAKQVRDLQHRWREAADVPRAQGDALWKRFKAAHDEAWKRCESHFAAQAQERAENLTKKVTLCERAEALSSSTSWIQTADEIKKLQAQWKTIGAVTRGQEKAIWERFRGACDKFFSRRHADLAERKTLWAENLAKKEALCARVEAIAESTEWDTTANEIRRLQGEWKAIGPVKKSRSEALWQRFRGACDKFFTRHAQRHDVAKAERLAAREAICAELEALTAPGEPPADLMAKVRALRARWQQELALRGVDRDRAIALEERAAAAFSRVLAQWPSVFGGTDLDPDANRRKLEALVLRMEDLATSLTAGAGPEAALSPTTRLAAMLKEALASNTIGGKVDDEARFRAANDEVRQAQANWSRIGVVPEDARRPLADRFQRAIRRITERSGGPGGRPPRPIDGS